MEVSQKATFDSFKHNNLVLQRLKSKEKKSDENSKECKDKLENKLGNIFKEISLRNESNAFKVTMSGEIQKITNLSKKDANLKFLVLSYSKLFLTLINLKNNCDLEDIKFHTLELRKLNFIFKNCNHFNFKNKLINGSGEFCLENKAKNVLKEIAIPIQEKPVQKDKLDLLNKIDSLNGSVNDLKTKIKQYFSNNIQEEILSCKDQNTQMDDESISLIDSKSNTDQCNCSDPSSFETSNDENYTNSEEEINFTNSNKDSTELKTKNKNNFIHRRSVETISFTGNKLENIPFVEFSPAPKYHSRSRTQNTNFFQQGQTINHLGLPLNGILVNKPPINNQPISVTKTHKIVESANLNHRLLIKSISGGIPHAYTNSAPNAPHANFR